MAPKYKEKGIEASRIGVVVPLALRARLEAIADVRGWSLSQTCKDALELYAEKMEAELTEPKREAT